ncbi:Rho GTPase-activating protein 12 [Liparis tanakae]|uniref:Rho GTPase-activating protein 12 n=1 Tax=Liparis tanakae TaxID=230148 RepID=A0A4Z2F2Z8_9TELE|nr:Rho GTPase-activating protein 12 [Liparis tanakae]
MAELPIAPGDVYIEVEYDYEYKAKDRTITIQQGECYMLVKKSNDDWWQVRKEEGAKAFYVPAQYVREVRKALMPPPKSLHHHHAPPAATTAGSGVLWVKPTSLDLGLHGRSTENLHQHEARPRRSSSGHPSPPGPPGLRRDSAPCHPPPGSPTADHDRAPADVLVPPPHKGGSGTLPRARARSPDMERAPLDVDDRAHRCDSAGEERRTNDSESGDELSSSSTEHLQVTPRTTSSPTSDHAYMTAAL